MRSSSGTLAEDEDGIEEEKVDDNEDVDKDERDDVEGEEEKHLSNIPFLNTIYGLQQRPS